MKTKLLTGLIGCLSIFSATAQTITAPVGQNISIANSMDVTGDVNLVSGNNVIKFGSNTILKNYNTDNVGIGIDALKVVSGGFFNVAVGYKAGSALTNAGGNVMIGAEAGKSATGIGNTFVGNGTGKITTGDNNLFYGYGVGSNNTTGSRNIFIGAGAGNTNSGGNDNIFLGENAGYSMASGTGNTFVGRAAASSASSGTDITLLGNATSINNGLTNATAIGANAAVIASNSIVLGSGANVGIGTNAPANKLEINKAGVSGLRLTGLAGVGSSAGRALSVDINGDVVLVNVVTSPFAGARQDLSNVSNTATLFDKNWSIENNNLKNANPNGGVIIGASINSTPSGYKLYVEDGILTEKVKVAIKGTDEWADFVFKSDYKMKTLGEVDAYIKANKHLPGVPSAEEMVKEGNDLHKTDVKLLQKVEELTLYMIEMEKRLSKAEAQNVSLRKALRKK